MKHLLLALTFVLLSFSLAKADEKEPIKIGDMAAYTKGAIFTMPYKRGVDMAVAEINAAGGVLGRPLEIFSRDTKGDPGEAVRVVEELVGRDGVEFIINSDFSNTSVAVSNWAARNKIPMVVTSSETDTLVWAQGNAYTFRVNAGGYMLVAATLKKAEEIYGDAIKGKKWATVSPNFEFGQSIVASLKQITADKGWNPEWVNAQWPAYDQLDAGSAIGILEKAKPDIVFVGLFDSDFAKFVREARKREFLKDRIFMGPLIAVPEHMALLGAEMPDDWVSCGFPYDDINTPEFVKFKEKYNARYPTEPMKTYTVNGYNGVYALKSAIEKAGSTEAEAVRRGLTGLDFNTPIGPLHIRAIDHQATAPVWVGTSAVENGKPKLANWSVESAAGLLPSDDWVKSVRPKEKE